jgi:hypothetical protein
MAKFRMARISRPAWADEPTITREGVTDADYRGIQARRAAMLDAVQQEVEKYLNTRELHFKTDADGFPNRSCMTGQYYLSDESYYGNLLPGAIQISIFCRCLQRPALLDTTEPEDYLGLEVWLRCVPGEWSFEVFRNTDSSSI